MVSETTMGREPVTYVQIDQDFCNLDYGVYDISAYSAVPSTVKDLTGGSSLTPNGVTVTGAGYDYGLYFAGSPSNSYMTGIIPEFPTGTVECILRPAGLPEGANATVLHAGLVGQSRGFGIMVNDSNVVGIVGIHNGNGVNYSTYVLAIGTTYRLAVTYDGSTARLYVKPLNGSIQEVLTLTGVSYAAGKEVWAMRRDDNQVDYAIGDLADCRLWSSIRSQAEIDADAFDELTGNEAGLAHYWPLGDLTGCPALLGVTGEQKCFKTRATCQVPQSYDRGTLPLTFTKRREDVGVDGLYVIPSLESVSTVPTRINPGGSSSDAGPLGNRANVDLRFVDHPHSDIRVDPYRDERSYIATDRGTFWSKWLARNPYYNNRRLRIYEGYNGQTLAEMNRRTYIIDAVEGPSAGGTVRVRAKDILKLADDESAQAPRPSQGELQTSISPTSSSLAVVNYLEESDYPAGGGTVRIGDEVMTYTSASYSNDVATLSGLTRGTDGTTADDHDAEDRVQLCIRVNSTRVDSITYDLLTVYGNVPPEFIDFAAWQAEADVWLNQYNLSTLITEPTGVTTLLGELTEQCIFLIWWDERQQLIPLEAVKPPSGDVPVFTDEQNLIAGSPKLSTRPKERISQIWLYYGIRNPTEDIDEEANYRRLRIRADVAAESEDQYGEQKIKKIFSRWLRTDAQVLNATTRLLSRFRNNPRYLTIDVDAKDRDQWTGDVIDVQTRGVVDIYGALRRTRWQILSAEEIENGHTMRYNLETYEYGVGQRFGSWMVAGAPVYSAASDEEKQSGAFWADSSNTVGDNDEPYRWS